MGQTLELLTPCILDLPGRSIARLSLCHDPQHPPRQLFEVFCARQKKQTQTLLSQSKSPVQTTPGTWSTCPLPSTGGQHRYRTPPPNSMRCQAWKRIVNKARLPVPKGLSSRDPWSRVQHRGLERRGVDGEVHGDKSSLVSCRFGACPSVRFWGAQDLKPGRRCTMGRRKRRRDGLSKDPPSSAGRPRSREVSFVGDNFTRKPPKFASRFHGVQRGGGRSS